MSDHPPHSPRPAEPAYEVPLVGDGPLADRERQGDGRPPHTPNWRRIVGVASLGGVVLGVLTSVVLLGFVWDEDRNAERNDDRTDEDTAPSLVGADPSTQITTPPTLSPLDPIPAPDGAATGPARPGAPARDASLLDQVVVPTLPTRPTGGDTIPAGSFDLGRAVSTLATDVARRSSTRLELGVGGYLREFTFRRDPSTNRFEFTDGQVLWIVDVTSGLTYLGLSAPGEQRFVSQDNARVADYFGAESIGVFMNRLLIGPLRPDTIDSATSTPGAVAVLDDGATPVMAYTVELPGSAVPEWQLYALGPTDEFLPSDRPDRLTYTVYVDAANHIRRIVGLADLGGIPQLVVHDIETLTEPTTIELPDPATVERAPPG